MHQLFVSVYWFQCHVPLEKHDIWHLGSMPPSSLNSLLETSAAILVVASRSLLSMPLVGNFVSNIRTCGRRTLTPSPDRTQPQCVAVILLSVRCERTFETAVAYTTPHIHHHHHHHIWPLATVTAVCISNVTRWKSLIN